MSQFLDANATVEQLPWSALVREIGAVLEDGAVTVPERLVQPLPGGASLLAMPAHDARIAIAKLITFTPANAGTARPAIQGDVIVFDIATGERRLVLDGPTVTARRTAAVTVFAAQQLAPQCKGPLLVVGAGVQARAHVEAFAAVLGVKEILIASRTAANAQALADHARSLGLAARVVPDANAALADCPLAVTCTPATQPVLTALPRDDAFIAAVGAFTPTMAELGPELCRHCAERGGIVLDTADAVAEAGDLIQAGLDLRTFPALDEIVAQEADAPGTPVLFKSCGWAGWDLAAARCAVA